MKKITIYFSSTVALFYCFIILFSCSTSSPKSVTMVNPETLSDYDYNQSVVDKGMTFSLQDDAAIPSSESITRSPYAIEYRQRSDSMDHLKKAFGLIAKHEKYRAKKYWAPEKKYLIGYGFLYKNHKTSYMPKKTADRILMRKIKEYDVYIDKLVKVELTNNERAALLSFMYNVGITKFHKSTLLEYVNKNRMKLASNEFGRWIRCNGRKLGGLKIRRYAERNLFLS